MVQIDIKHIGIHYHYQKAYWYTLSTNQANINESKSAKTKENFYHIFIN